MGDMVSMKVVLPRIEPRRSPVWERERRAAYQAVIDAAQCLKHERVRDGELVAARFLDHVMDELVRGRDR
jgi:hypothetical protein